MMRIRNLILVLLLVPGTGLADVTVDRVVVSVGNIAITESDIAQEVRLAQFLDGEPQSASPSESQRDEARQRLVEQTLLAEEAEADKTELSGIPDEVTRLVREVRKLYSDEAAYKAALASTGFNEDQLSRRLARNVKILRLINRRLRPNAAVDRRDIETYYRETFLPDFAKQEQGPPPNLEEVETVIRETLTQQKVDELLDQWLKEIQSTRRVKVHSN